MSSSNQSVLELRTRYTPEMLAKLFTKLAFRAEKVAEQIATTDSPSMTEYVRWLITYRKLEAADAENRTKKYLDSMGKAHGMPFVWSEHCHNFLDLFEVHATQRFFAPEFCEMLWKKRHEVTQIMNDPTNLQLLGSGTERNATNDLVIFAISRSSRLFIFEITIDVKVTASLLGRQAILNVLRDPSSLGALSPRRNPESSLDDIREVAHKYGTLLGFEQDDNQEFAPQTSSSSFTPVASTSRQPVSVLTSNQGPQGQRQPRQDRQRRQSRRCCF
ncbi:hypothetical protein JCM5350_006765 [Sporobolomyces pararoseus]